ncbi:XTP/dITP diphosphatase [Fictibacillus phosphorivorans]|uniref:XTP/dITP diphosphatase n=1 Tax=Fictibacillus phosphorivorans TaxID=1221500 RepID=UPI00203E5CE2|nr:XTP/dITP diphosphatase [Fictibacillus phosphorivorans]MCM3717849.1 XTP/dITP diphosphatase [Fictibacillus phosphorivorans]MCM3775298.1 XTP/dITP diphosphatase [Fictibacillus phosphorivorans]
MKILIATKNTGKVKEFQAMFKDLGIEVLSLLDIKNSPDVEETGVTFDENAIIKAEAICSMMNIPVIADDSGLEVDALEGRPGVYSARYAGSEKSDEANMDKVLKEMSDVAKPDRTARFVCALAFARPEKKTFVVRGTCEGEILSERRGNEGFGYDPIFYLPQLNCSMAELSKEEKNKISHRAVALKKLKDFISKEDMLWQRP